MIFRASSHSDLEPSLTTDRPYNTYQ